MENKRVTNEVLANEIRNLASIIGKLEQKLDTYTPTKEIDLRFAEVKRDIIQIEARILDIERKVAQKQSWQIIGSNILTAFLTGTLVTLVTYFVQTASK